jgi:tripartite-type tricarboxylate transporter receptor subunit TctC
VRLAPTLTDLLAGHVDLSCTNLAGEQLKGGTLKGFGVASKDRFAPYPNLPSLVQSGLALVLGSKALDCLLVIPPLVSVAGV